MENSKNSSLSKLIPVMLCFFAMGFVDLVGIASNYVKADLGLSDSQANIFPSLVFFWFLIFSVPTGMLMSRIGQQKTVLLSLIVTFRFSVATRFRRQLYADVDFLLPPGHWKCVDADFSESVTFQYRAWRPPGE